jgi:tetratricopeptide (TPR) repeat protein
MRDTARLTPVPAQELQGLWRQGHRPDLRAFLDRAGELCARELVDVLLVDQRERWLLGERVPAEVYLREYPTVSRESEAAFELIYAEIMIREKLGETAIVEEYWAAYPEFKARLKLQLDLHEALEASTEDGVDYLENERSDAEITLGDADDCRWRDDPIASVVSGCEILDEIGRGGMGVVYRARQLRLNRIVALKMILAGNHAGPETMSRFLNEAEVIARIQHRNIVQVHQCGGEGELPYLVMEYVDGGSLARVLDGTPFPVNDAARLVEQIARGIAAAHQSGVIHRDLTPANILLTASGEPKIADFGLAKILEADSGLTGTESILGTACYMAPEQAGGRTQPVGRAADLYSLGAILYELLTGRPPFKAATALLTLDLVKTHEPVPPSRLRPGLPPDIETICLKCLEKDPARRFESADALADDLGRFRAGKPILARRITVFERSLRWCGRNRAVAGLAVAVVLVFLSGFVGVATQWYRAEAHLRAEERQRKEAEKNLQLEVAARAEAQKASARERAARRHSQAQLAVALEAIKTYHTGLSRDVLLKEPRLEGLRTHLLGTALKLYERLKAELDQDTDPLAPAELADAYARLASLMWTVGSRTDAAGAYERAIELRERIARAVPNDSHNQYEMADLLNNLGGVFRDLGRRDEGIHLHQRALEICESLARAQPNDPGARGAAAWSHANLGTLYREQGLVNDSVRECEQAVKIREALHRERPDDPQVRSDFGCALLDLCLALCACGRAPEGLDAIRRAVEIHEALVRDEPSAPQMNERLANSLLILGYTLQRLGQPAESLSLQRRALAILARREKDTPNASRLQSAITRCHYQTADALRLMGRFDEALTELRQALPLVEFVARQDPTVIPNRREVARLHHSMASLFTALGREQEAIDEYRAAITICQAILPSHPDEVRLWTDIEFEYYLLSDALRKQGRLAEALEACDAGTTLAMKKERSKRGDPGYQTNLAMSLQKLARLRAELGQYAEAIETQERVVVIREQLSLAAPEARDRVVNWAAANHWLGHRYYSAGKHARAIESFQRARAIIEGLPTPSAEDLFNTACVWAMLGEMYEQRSAALAPANEPELRCAGDRAMVVLTQAVASGYRNEANLRSDRDLASLRTRDDFQALLADVLFPKNPFASTQVQARVDANDSLAAQIETPAKKAP